MNLCKIEFVYLDIWNIYLLCLSLCGEFCDIIQHDINERQLKMALDGVVEDAVCLVGANLNVASEALLR